MNTLSVILSVLSLILAVILVAVLIKNRKTNRFEELSQALGSGVDEDVRQRLAEAKNLTDTVEELEEDLEEAEKKNKKLQAANAKLQDEQSEAECQVKNLSRDLEEKQSSLDRLQQETAIRKESLDFVKEVLTAQRTDDTSVMQHYRHVDAMVDFIQGELKETLDKTKCSNSGIGKFLGKDELTTWAILKKKTWIQGKTAIAFVGEFSAGKTSIVNALLSDGKADVLKLPTSSAPTTAIPTYITGGKGTYYQFFTPDNILKRISEKTFKRISKEVLDQVEGVSSLIQYFVMTYENPNLEKMSILDTPGFSSGDGEDAERTIGVINECDALFWVFDVQAGTVNRTSLDIIKKHLKKPLYVVINKIDTKGTKDVDEVERYIRKQFKDDGVEVKDVVRFSNAREDTLEDMKKAIKGILHDDSHEHLLDNLTEEMQKLTKEAENATKEALNAAIALENKHGDLAKQFKSELRSLKNDCEEVCSMPQEKKHWISANDYRMSKMEYGEFCNHLGEISDKHANRLDSLYKEQEGTIGELEKAWKRHAEAKEKQRLLQNCKDRLVKKSRSLNFDKGNYNQNKDNNIIKDNKNDFSKNNCKSNYEDDYMNYFVANYDKGSVDYVDNTNYFQRRDN